MAHAFRELSTARIAENGDEQTDGRTDRPTCEGRNFIWIFFYFYIGWGRTVLENGRL